jgi:hypothetical protein
VIGEYARHCGESRFVSGEGHGGVQHIVVTGIPALLVIEGSSGSSASGGGCGGAITTCGGKGLLDVDAFEPLDDDAPPCAPRLFEPPLPPPRPLF